LDAEEVEAVFENDGNGFGECESVFFFIGADDFTPSVEIVEGGGKFYEIGRDKVWLKLFRRALHHFGKTVK